ncbi:hypothetical protein E5288_WYG022056 [Bos mutus]|uniref:Uncharacterized protein n=1 Tax=Bos mutus TaxID=72004 RepID=A0A6B0S0W8_9CETA|nr:hypothetical protein [Bos mutus]
MRVAESEALEQLEQVALYEGKRNASEHRGIHEFLEILVQKLKNQLDSIQLELYAGISLALIMKVYIGKIYFQDEIEYQSQI